MPSTFRCSCGFDAGHYNALAIHQETCPVPPTVKPLTPPVETVTVGPVGPAARAHRQTPVSASDPRLVAMCKAVAELAGPGAEFFVAVAFPDASGVSSLSNIAAARQPELLRVLLHSFESGAAVQTDHVVLDRKRG